MRKGLELASFILQYQALCQELQKVLQSKKSSTPINEEKVVGHRKMLFTVCWSKRKELKYPNL